MKQVAKFEKVSYLEYYMTMHNMYPNYSEAIIQKLYEDIMLPKRATKYSAGYDFFAPDAFVLEAGKTILIPTGIRCQIDPGYVLSIYPRSGLGFKYRVQLDNTVGIIDGDYYESDNEGHIFVKLSCDSYNNDKVVIKKGQGFVQGIFTEYGITYDDDTTTERNGGMGSTDQK